MTIIRNFDLHFRQISTREMFSWVTLKYKVIIILDIKKTEIGSSVFSFNITSRRDMKHVWTNVRPFNMLTKTISSNTVSKHLAPTSSNNSLHKVTDEITHISCSMNVHIIWLVTWYTKELNCDIKYTTLLCKRSLLGQVSTNFYFMKQ
jgi:hypothetical protein